jgi:hypothetical protein
LAALSFSMRVSCFGADMSVCMRILHANMAVSGCMDGVCMGKKEETGMHDVCGLSV